MRHGSWTAVVANSVVCFVWLVIRSSKAAVVEGDVPLVGYQAPRDLVAPLLAIFWFFILARNLGAASLYSSSICAEFFRISSHSIAALLKRGVASALAALQARHGMTRWRRG